MPLISAPYANISRSPAVRRRGGANPASVPPPPDTTPDAFVFTDAVNVAVGTVSTSNSITVTGIAAPSSITVTGGEYEKNTSGSWTTSAGTVVNGDTVRVRGTSSASNSSTVNVVLNIGGVTDTYSITTVAAADTVPDAFTFTDATNVAVSTVSTSNSVTITGINAAAPINVTGGQYEKNLSGTWTGTAGTAVSGDTVKVRGTSSASNSTAVNVVLDVGGVTDTYTITTVAAGTDTIPDAFTFTDVGGVALNTLTVSNSITVTGINAPSPISVATNAVWTPADLAAGLLAWYYTHNGVAAGTLITHAAGVVSQYSDASGNSRHLPQPTVGDRPIYSGNVITTAAASTQQFVGAGMPTVYDFAVVGTPNPPTAWRTLVWNSAAQNAILVENGTTRMGSYTGSLNIAGAQVWSGFGQAYVSIQANNSISMGRDGSALSAESGPNLALTATPRIMNGGPGGEGFGSTQEMIFMSPNQSAANRDRVAGYLAWKWDAINGNNALVTLLPGGHTYKAATPPRLTPVEYELNASGTWTSSPGTVVSGDTVRVRATSSASAGTPIDTTLTIGGVSDTFTITT